MHWRYHFILISLLLLPVGLQAQYPSAGLAAEQGNVAAPGVLLKQGIEKLLAFLEGGGASQQDKLVDFVEREIAPYFDFVSMTQWSLGPQARYMNEAQRREAVNTVRSMFLNALVRNLMQYEPGRVQYLPPRRDPYAREITLSVQSYPRHGYPLRLDFHFYLAAQGWKIHDVAANGLKATTVYREYFNQQRRGPRGMPGYGRPRY